MKLQINLQKDFRELMMEKISQLIELGFEFQSYDSWKEKNGDYYDKYEIEQLVAYANLRQKIPEEMPRNVLKCNTFICPDKYKIYVNELEQKIINGEPLFPYLSRKIMKPLFCDKMLYDFGITHFHLGNKKSKKNELLIEGSKDLLFAFMEGDNCYFIEINTHGKFDDENFLEKLKASFPEVLKKWEIGDVKSINCISNDDRKKLKKMCVNTPLEMNGKYYAPFGGGMSVIGTSPLAHHEMAKKYLYFDDLELNLKYFLRNKKMELENNLKIKIEEMVLQMVDVEPIKVIDKINKIEMYVKIEGQKLYVEYSMYTK